MRLRTAWFTAKHLGKLHQFTGHSIRPADSPIEESGQADLESGQVPLCYPVQIRFVAEVRCHLNSSIQYSHV